MFGVVVIANLLAAIALAQPEPTCTDQFSHRVCVAQDVLTEVTELTDYDYLVIEQSNIVSIKPGAFKNLTIKTLYFAPGTQFSNLQAGVFAGLRSLNILGLRQNNVTLIPDLFQELSLLNKLYLTNNSINEIPEGSFNGLSQLTNLRLENNDIASIDQTTFNGLTSLEFLDLGDNEIASIAPESFLTNGKLRSLYLNGNDLTEIKPNTFKGLAKLKSLFLQNNEISDIQPGAFDGLSSLEKISLSNNKIYTLPTALFARLSNLQTLYFANNTLAEISRVDLQLASSAEVDYILTA